MTAGVGVLRHRALGKKTTQHLVGGPANGANRGDSEPLVYRRSAGVIDASHHMLDAIRLTGNSGSQDVGVVPAADGSKRVRVLDTGLHEGVPVESEAGYP